MALAGSCSSPVANALAAPVQVAILRMIQPLGLQRLPAVTLQLIRLLSLRPPQAMILRLMEQSIHLLLQSQERTHMLQKFRTYHQVAFTILVTNLMILDRGLTHSIYSGEATPGRVEDEL